MKTNKPICRCKEENPSNVLSDGSCLEHSTKWSWSEIYWMSFWRGVIVGVLGIAMLAMFIMMMWGFI